MGSTWQLLERGFVGGIVFAAACAGFAGFFYLLYRLINLMRPKEVRQEQKRILSHRLYKVSGRGRIAYLILCLEGALRFYGQDFSAWEWVLRRLWSITDCSENDWIDIWLESIGELLPSEVLTNNTTESASAEISKARVLYIQAGAAMIVINTAIENAYTIVGQWDYDTTSNDSDAIRLIEKVEETMMAFGVPLPSNEIIQPLFEQKDFSLGKPFDGLRFSYISKQRSKKWDDIRDGFVSISDELTIYPGFSFEQFKRTKFYKGQDGIKIIYLDGQQSIDDRKYIVSLFFRNGTIYIVSLICCDREFSENNEKERKKFHDDILNKLGIRPQARYSWGKITSDYDAKSNLSSINVVYDIK